MRKILTSLILSGSLAFSAVADEKTSTRDFSVVSAPLTKALTAFARQAGVSIVLPRLSYRDGRSRTVKGELTVEAGLARLLKRSGFAFERMPSGAFRVYRRPTQPPVASKPAGTAKFIPELPRIEEILVSVTRRLDAVQKLPYAISVFSGTALEDGGIKTTHSLLGKIPSLSSSSLGRGRNKLVLRGLSDGAFSGSTQSLVATYLDYTRLTYNAPEPGLALYDIEQVEFLRGPQGSLYGSGALGGLYRIVTRQPDLDQAEAAVGAGVAITKRGGVSYNTDGIVNLPLGGGAGALRVVGYHERDAGYIDDIGLGLTNINAARTSGGRATLALAPWEAVQLSLGAIYQDHKSENTGYYDADLGSFERTNRLAEPYEDEILQLVGRIDADLGFADLVSSTAWMERDIASTLDATLAISELTGNGDPAASPYNQNRRIETLTHETHLTSRAGGRLEWLIGLFVSRRESVQQSEIITPGATANETLGQSDIIYAETHTDEIEEAAGFGELTWFANEKLSFTVGGRWFTYDIIARSVLDDVGADSTTVGEGDQHLSDFTPKFVVSYQPDTNSLFYLQGSEGFRVGGINLSGPTAQEEAEESEEDEENETEEEEAAEHALINFDPDETFNLEFGFKLTRLNGRLQLSSAAYHTWWKQVQTDQFSSAGLPIIGNVGDARSFGAEFEVQYRPSAAWLLRVNAAWNRSELTQVTEGFGQDLGAESGDRLPGSPSFMGGVGLSYQWQTAGSWSAVLGADYNYAGSNRLLFNEENTPSAEAYHLANIRLDLKKADWLVRFYIDNLFDSDANSFAFGNPFSLAAVSQITPLRPRTLGLEFRWTY